MSNKIEEFMLKRSVRIIEREFIKKNNEKYSNMYDAIRDFEWAFHGMKIQEGYITQNIIYETIKNSNRYCEVIQESKIPLNPDDKNKRKHHKVDVLCIDHERKKVDAHNSKGASFNNTQSQESELYDYNNFKEAIKKKYPGYEVNYKILKDNYDENEPKYKLKCKYLSDNGIKHFSTQEYLKDNYNLTNFEEIRKKRVYYSLKERLKSRSLNVELLKDILV